MVGDKEREGQRLKRNDNDDKKSDHDGNIYS
jgi:hypothetical protein